MENSFQLVMLVDLPNHLKKKFEPILILVYCKMYRMYLKDPEHHARCLADLDGDNEEA